MKKNLELIRQKTPIYETARKLFSMDTLSDLIVFITVFGIYWLSAWVTQQTQTPLMSYFDDLAASFLHGKIFLENPIAVHDLTFYEGKWFVPFLPLPTFLMLPWIAIRGSINTVLFSVFLGAINVVIIFKIMKFITKSKWAHKPYIDNVWLSILFSLGSIHWYIAKAGSVWFLSQICTVTFMALSVWLAIRFKSPFMSGLALGAAMWARPHVILMYPLLIGIGYKEYKDVKINGNFSFIIRWFFLSAIPLVTAIIGILGYNWLRFDNLFDFGYLTQNIQAQLKNDLITYGQFNLYYMPRNLYAMLFSLPKWNGSQLIADPWGMSIFFTSPAFLFLAKARERSPIVIGAWLSILLITIPLLTYYNTGWYQFGYRFSLDFIVPTMVLLAFATEGKMSSLMKVFITVGVLVNLWGLLWCCF